MSVPPSFIPDTAPAMRNTGSTSRRQVIPDSKPRAEQALGSISVISGYGSGPKLLSRPQIDISELSHAEGFSWQPKQPHPPGFFSGTRRQPSLNPDEPRRTAANLSGSSQQSCIPDSVPTQIPVIPCTPLALPDLCLADHSAKKSRSSVLRSGLTNSLQEAPSPAHSAHGNGVLDAAAVGGDFPSSGSTSIQVATKPIQPLAKRSGISSSRQLVSESPRSQGHHSDPFKVVESSASEAHQAERAAPHGNSNSIHAAYQTLRRGSPTSTCGDLEGPGCLVPTRQNHLFDNGEGKGKEFSQLRTPRGHETSDRDRSQSRASNISKKRSSMHKDRPRKRHDPERKRAAMLKVASQWNECIRIVDEEKLQTSQELERLQHEMGKQKSELDKCLRRLEEKDERISHLEAIHGESEERLQQAQSESSSLESKVASLQGEVSDTRTRAASLVEKCRNYKSKLNEAIKEQQHLFSTSRDFYKSMMSEIQDWGETRKSEVAAVQKALDESKTKHDDIKLQLKQLRQSMSDEMRANQESESAMKQQLSNCENDLSIEKGINAGLRQQIEAHEESTEEQRKSERESLEAKLDSLLDVCVNSHLRLAENAQGGQPLRNQLELILKKLSTVSEQPSSRPDLEPIVQAAQQNIIARLLPAILALINRHHATDQTLDQVRTEMHSGFTGLDGKMSLELSQAIVPTSEYAGRDEHLNVLLGKLSNELADAKRGCARLEKRLENYTQAEQKSAEAHRVNLFQQVQEREAKITNLEGELRETIKSYACEVKALRARFQEDDEAAKNHWHQLADDLRNKLDETFQRERKLSEQELQQSEAAREYLESELRQVKEKLQNSGSQDTDKLRESLQQKQESVDQLRERIKELEEQTQAHYSLDKRRQHDIETINELRTEITNVCDRIPGLESFKSTMDHIEEVNNHIVSTAGFLKSERSWVEYQLQANRNMFSRARTPGDTMPIADTGAALEPIKDSNHALRETVSDNSSTHALERLCELGPAMSFTEESSRRRVTVQSPCVNAEASFPPPSIQQEQRRRREAIKARPILKLKSESQDSQESLLRAAQTHSLYNRPVFGGISSAALQKTSTVPSSSTSEAGHQVIQQIRAGLIQQKRPLRSWDLPTVADFEKSQQTSQDDDQAEPRDGPQMGDEVKPAPKKPKLNKSNESEKTAAGLRRGDANSQLLPRAFPHRPMTRTFSRQLTK